MRSCTLPGHPFVLDMSANDKACLIAFLKRPERSLGRRAANLALGTGTLGRARAGERLSVLTRPGDIGGWSWETAFQRRRSEVEAATTNLHFGVNPQGTRAGFQLGRARQPQAPLLRPYCLRASKRCQAMRQATCRFKAPRERERAWIPPPSDRFSSPAPAVSPCEPSPSGSRGGRRPFPPRGGRG